MASLSDEQDAAHRYEKAEEAFLAAVRADKHRAALTALADDVAIQAKAWNTQAYAAYHASRGEGRESLDHVTERTEVLESLWSDIARAFHGRAAQRDG